MLCRALPRRTRAQVEIAEDEPEDVAVRRYMKAVMQSGVINKVRDAGVAACVRACAARALLVTAPTQKCRRTVLAALSRLLCGQL